MASNRAGEDGLAPLIAVVGSDGSGKSTLSADLVKWLSEIRSVENVYLGLGTGDLGNRIKQWPIIGRRLEKTLSKKAGQARDKKGRFPGVPTALVIYFLSRIRMKRFRAMMAKRKRGIMVITDRYPQTEVAGFYEGPGLSAARVEGRLVQWLAARELKLYQSMAAVLPDLIIRLNIDVDTALARKPDHKRALLEAKVAVTPKLTFNGAPIVDLSSLDPYEAVLDQAKKAIAAALPDIGKAAPAN